MKLGSRIRGITPRRLHCLHHLIHNNTYLTFIVGLGFMTLQTLSYSGYITIDHDRMKKEVENWMDLNKDGKVDADDSKLAINKVLRVLEYNMPGGGGFAAGFIGGIRSG